MVLTIIPALSEVNAVVHSLLVSLVHKYLAAISVSSIEIGIITYLVVAVSDTRHGCHPA
jgi:hypothetical protein